MSNAEYNDAVAKLSLFGFWRSIARSPLNALRLTYVELRTRYAPVFA